jgi:WD40 repeat protein
LNHGGTTNIRDVESGELKKTLEGHSYGVSVVAYSSDGKSIVTGSEDCTAKIWDVESGELKRTLEGHSEEVRSVAYSSDGKSIVTGSEDCNAKIWDVESELKKTLEGHSSHVTSVAYSSDGKFIVAKDPSITYYWSSTTFERVTNVDGQVILSSNGVVEVKDHHCLVPIDNCVSFTMDVVPAWQHTWSATKLQRI